MFKKSIAYSFILIALIIFPVNPVLAVPGFIYKVAGGQSGDGGSATSVPIGGSHQGSNRVLANPDGSFYVSETYEHRVRFVDANGNIQTIAGTGEYGYSGDGGPATSARLAHPAGLAKDALGNLYIGELGNEVVRKVAPNGVISTFAGGGVLEPGSTPLPATLVDLGLAFDVATDAQGNAYIASDVTILKVDSLGMLTKIAGTGEYGYSGDGGPAISAKLTSVNSVTTDSSGNIFVGEEGARIRKISNNGTISTTAGNGVNGYSGDGGLAVNAQINGSPDVEADLDGGLLLTGDGAVRKIGTDGIINRIAGLGSAPGPNGGDGGQAIDARISNPTSLSRTSPGDLYVGQSLAVRKINSSGIINIVAGNYSYCVSNGDGGLAINASICEVYSLTVRLNNTIFFVDGIGASAKIRKIDTNGTITTAYTSTDFSNAYPAHVYADQQGNLYVITHYYNHKKIYKINNSGVITHIAGADNAPGTGDGGPAISAGFGDTSGITVDANGNVYVSDSNTQSVRKIDATSGIINTIAGNGVGGYTGDGGPAPQASLNNPAGLSVDSLGVIYIADRSNHVIRKVDTNGIITTFAGTGQSGNDGEGGPATSAMLWQPRDVKVGNGNIYIVDGSHRILAVNSLGILTRVAGATCCGGNYNGDDQLAINAWLSSPYSISIGTQGLYIADVFSFRIRLVEGSF